MIVRGREWSRFAAAALSDYAPMAVVSLAVALGVGLAIWFHATHICVRHKQDTCQSMLCAVWDTGSGGCSVWLIENNPCEVCAEWVER